MRGKKMATEKKYTFDKNDYLVEIDEERQQDE